MDKSFGHPFSKRLSLAACRLGTSTWMATSNPTCRYTQELKAVYVSPSEYYAFWREMLPDADLSWGAFGENFTTPLNDKAVHIGHQFRIGSTEFVVTQPRIPCFKLGIRFGRADMVRRFLRSGRNGFYLRVTHEGGVAAGDSVECIARDQNGVSVADIVELYTARNGTQELLQWVSELSSLPENWPAYFRKRLSKRNG
jgi:MOSC domain-containing protein YiiM